MDNPLLAAFQDAQTPATPPPPIKKKITKAKQGTTPVQKPASRIGMRQVTSSHAPEVLKQFNLLKIERDTTIQELMIEALNDLFRKYDKNPIA